MAKDRINELATRIYEALKAKGADIGNAAVAIIEAELSRFVSDSLTITGPTYFEDDEPCGYCQREIGTPHKMNCRQ